MKAVVFHAIGDIRLDEVDEPRIQEPTDAIVRLTATAICGTDLHLVRGTLPGMKPGTILGHEGVGIVEEVGRGVRNVLPGDRVLIPSTISCGACPFCRRGEYSQCDRANPKGPSAGTSFFGGPESSGPAAGLQAELARIPQAQAVLVPLPDDVTDDQAILLSDIFPTGYFGAEIAGVRRGTIVAVFGCGPVGLCAIASARLRDAARIIAVDHHPDRLEEAKALGAETIDFNAEDPVDAIRDLTGGVGADASIDAVGVDAEMPHRGPAARKADRERSTFKRECSEVAPETHPAEDGSWTPGDAPSQALSWAVDGVAKAGTVAIIGVYPEGARSFPIGKAMSKNLTVRMGNCNHLAYARKLIRWVRSGVLDPEAILSQKEPMVDAVEAYRAFDHRQTGWIKVELQPTAAR